MKPGVSFIIPFYNSGGTILETVKSIFAQTYRNYDVWIVNDGSTDQHSLDVLTELARKDKIKVLHQENAGPSVARNNAIKQTRAPFIVPIDSDDKIAPDALQAAMDVLTQEERVGVVYGHLKFFGGRDSVKKQWPFDPKKQLIYNQLAVCCVIRKAVFEDCGYYDEFLSKPGLEDWEFWLRMGQSEWLFRSLDKVFFEIRVNEDSRTYQVANKNLDLIREYVFKKHASFLAKAYNELFYEKKMLLETPDYRIGNRVMAPWRLVKSMLKR